jgi:hypothetical protein
LILQSPGQEFAPIIIEWMCDALLAASHHRAPIRRPAENATAQIVSAISGERRNLPPRLNHHARRTDANGAVKDHWAIVESVAM